MTGTEIVKLKCFTQSQFIAYYYYLVNYFCDQYFVNKFACGFWCCGCCCFIYLFNFCIFLHSFVHIIITCTIGNLCKLIDLKLVGASKWRESEYIQMKFDFHKFWKDNSANLIKNANFLKTSSHFFLSAQYSI